MIFFFLDKHSHNKNFFFNELLKRLFVDFAVAELFVTSFPYPSTKGYWCGASA